ncbi:Uncharacterised protein [Vibrio cholerae]|nr:Uncharacterised protein [Vibrio cholerae]CSI14892.1 Uncharacterised protein [Vibrio cholerae]
MQIINTEIVDKRMLGKNRVPAINRAQMVGFTLASRFHHWIE